MADGRIDHNPDEMGGHYATFVARFMAQDEKISELEKTVSAMVPTIERLDNEFFNHDGGPGLKTIVLKHIAKVDARDEAMREFHNKRDQEIKDALALRDSEATRRNNRIMAWIAFIGLCVAALTLVIATFAYLEGRRQVKSGELKIGEAYQTAQRTTPSQDATGKRTSW